MASRGHGVETPAAGLAARGARAATIRRRAAARKALSEAPLGRRSKRAPAQSAAGADRATSYLIDGSGFHLPRLSRAALAQPQRRHADQCRLRLHQHAVEAGPGKSDAERPSPSSSISAETSFRNRIYPAYKEHPPARPPDDLVPAIQAGARGDRGLQHLARSRRRTTRPDDLIATYARLFKEQGTRVTIVSSDKDMMQLVDDQGRHARHHQRTPGGR